jgi:hypothetical protein
MAKLTILGPPGHEEQLLQSLINGKGPLAVEQIDRRNPVVITRQCCRQQPSVWVLHYPNPSQTSAVQPFNDVWLSRGPLGSAGACSAD